ncbi:pyruvate/ketoisovalerate ferredoxin oxidoreductase subunit gamma [Nocardioides szechwanensis]|uniref:Pyruvate ferredoxin oxidoreductase, gamma subunit n=1 Tax=Nocardioides szechwanensis TaxID=1005944 RepID=A0A1H0L2Q8_9ACTN|nr:2-oxoacid:acceptor oxidoreductase family protein [Nocardioides szechwanensis]GEP35593.1 pyruvate/ketoisovalerate ferredoxin oxidoreductase subunit gamma [Nocardioides szechwanensis]SDO62508.1 pyruvate ferredoxin oxidoreductase, gamma subunit [Nocardioides szechwanensis]
MFEIRIHGRGGQGTVTAAEMLSVAAFDEGWHAQAFPTFGSERTGAPVVAFCRLDRRPIRIHEPIAEPDAVIVQDPTMLHQVRVFEGLGPDSFVLVNTGRSFAELGMTDLVAGLRPGHALTVPATAIARETIGRPLPNTALLGGFAALTGAVSIDAVADAIRQRFEGRIGEDNVAAARAAYQRVQEQKEQVDARSEA